MIKLHEVGLRDGLQMESLVIPTETKYEWIKKLASTEIDVLQVGSFVNPKRMPQMADTDELFKLLKNSNDFENITFSGLVLNEKGYDRAVDCGVELICIGVSASDTHSTKNTGKSTNDALDEVLLICKNAIDNNQKIQASVQSAFGCGFEGKIDEEKVINIAKKYINNGIMNISLADTAGHANPWQVERIFKAIKNYNNDVNFTCHFHNTYGMGLANCYAALNSGVTTFETAFGGLGGCPFTKLAAGNVCTEDFVHFIQNQELRNDIDLLQLIDFTKIIADYFKRELPGFIYKSGPIKK
jgi:hydroxymethylglutaryl-CoA lyase